MEAPPYPDKGVMLLVVEDEYLIAAALVDDLTSASFAVHCCSDGIEAIAYLDEHAAKLAALITDVRLGAGPSGWEVAHQARVLNPDLPVVYTSGDSAHLWSQEGMPHSVMVQKPYVSAQVIAAVSGLLNIN